MLNIKSLSDVKKTLTNAGSGWIAYGAIALTLLTGGTTEQPSQDTPDTLRVVDIVEEPAATGETLLHIRAFKDRIENTESVKEVAKPVEAIEGSIDVLSENISALFIAASESPLKTLFALLALYWLKKTRPEPDPKQKKEEPESTDN